MAYYKVFAYSVIDLLAYLRSCAKPMQCFKRICYLLTSAPECVNTPIFNYLKSESSACIEYEETRVNWAPSQSLYTNTVVIVLPIFPDYASRHGRSHQSSSGQVNFSVDQYISD
jgi:hypothetical protein